MGPLPPGQVTTAVRHRTVEEVWFCIAGRGEVWRRSGDAEETVHMERGVALTIPLGTTFQSLLDEVRYRDARRLLANADLEIQQIAGALGYDDPPSFTRAFRRWSGRTPSAARALAKAGPR